MVINRILQLLQGSYAARFMPFSPSAQITNHFIFQHKERYVLTTSLFHLSALISYTMPFFLLINICIVPPNTILSSV